LESTLLHLLFLGGESTEFHINCPRIFAWRDWIGRDVEKNLASGLGHQVYSEPDAIQRVQIILVNDSVRIDDLAEAKPSRTEKSKKAFLFVAHNDFLYAIFAFLKMDAAGPCLLLR
jgi:hypothetical protein